MKREQYRYNTEIFIKKAKETHGDRYDYSKSNYINKRTNVLIGCKEHGYFSQAPMNHIRGQGCPVCGKLIAQRREMNCKNKRKTTEEFKQEIDKLYNGRYEVIGDYINNKTKVAIFCHNKNKNGEEHGIFYIKPNDLLCGHGCCRCVHSLMEKEISEFLTENGIKFETQKKFNWLGNQKLDFFLPEYNKAIECQGKQHFVPVDFKGLGENSAINLFNTAQKNDKKKKILCSENGIKILYFTNKENYKDFKCDYKLILDKKVLLTEILN